MCCWNTRTNINSRQRPLTVIHCLTKVPKPMSMRFMVTLLLVGCCISAEGLARPGDQLANAVDPNAELTRPGDPVTGVTDPDEYYFYSDNYDDLKNDDIPFPIKQQQERKVCSVCPNYSVEETNHQKALTFLIGKPNRVVPFTEGKTCQYIDGILRDVESIGEACDVARKIAFRDYIDPISFCECYVERFDDLDNSLSGFIDPPNLCPFCRVDKMTVPDWIVATSYNHTAFTCRDAAELAPFISESSYCLDVYTSWRRGCCDQDFEYNRCSVCNNTKKEKVIYPNKTVDFAGDSRKCGDIEKEIGFLVDDECTAFQTNVSSLDLGGSCGCSANLTFTDVDQNVDEEQQNGVASVDVIWLALAVFIIGSCIYICLTKLDALETGPDLAGDRWRQLNQSAYDPSNGVDTDTDGTSPNRLDIYGTRENTSRVFQTP